MKRTNKKLHVVQQKQGKQLNKWWNIHEKTEKIEKKN